MKKVLTAALTALTVLGAVATGAASAAPRHGGGRDRGGGAVAAGILGLGIGAALASPGYYYGPGPYYAGPYGYYGCPTQLRWSPRWRRYVPVSVCY